MGRVGNPNEYGLLRQILSAPLEPLSENDSLSENSHLVYKGIIDPQLSYPFAKTLE